MLPPPVAVSRRRRTGAVSPEVPSGDAQPPVGAPGIHRTSSSISEESDGTPVGPAPKKRRSGGEELGLNYYAVHAFTPCDFLPLCWCLASCLRHVSQLVTQELLSSAWAIFCTGRTSGELNARLAEAAVASMGAPAHPASPLHLDKRIGSFSTWLPDDKGAYMSTLHPYALLTKGAADLKNPQACTSKPYVSVSMFQLRFGRSSLSHQVQSWPRRQQHRSRVWQIDRRRLPPAMARAVWPRCRAG